MNKKEFSYPERFAVWKHHGEKCYLCEEPIRLIDSTCDHVLPEHLIEKPSELKKILKLLNLKPDFKINDYNNWMPSHLKCNQKKGKAPFRVTPLIQTIIDRLIRDTEVIRAIEHRFTKNSEKDKLLTQIMDGIASQTITQKDLENLFPGGRPTSDLDYTTIYDEVCLHLDPGRWKIVGRNGDIATVTDGLRGGITPVNQNPHMSWQCPTCWNYGPWNGARCMSCGMLSDPFD
ncbi:hypothetical protein CH369_18195 [Leptospira levettii]|uniref:hypothetical protein n=1 Tax=Leptospira levettii TaxID=2023178 RepID=UPI000C2B467D|nr:hypothetical protein [Leptospira levettii]MCW7475563.1 hypothetical protein [Leptospira levettii]PJZ98828.1 hypothetical protein CH369_18195 [Leptospira levettii]